MMLLGWGSLVLCLFMHQRLSDLELSRVKIIESSK
jgi:hypothetical protein